MNELFEKFLELDYLLHEYMSAPKPRWHNISETLKILWRVEQVLIQKHGPYWFHQVGG